MSIYGLSRVTPNYSPNTCLLLPCMASALQVILELFRRVLRLAKDYIERFPARYASIASHFAHLGRKLSALWHLWLGRGMFQRHKAAEPSFLRIGTSPYFISGDSIVKGCVAAASNVPTSVSHPSLHVAERQLQLANPEPPVGTPPPLESMSIDHPFAPNPIPFEGRSFANRSSGNRSVVSIHSRNDRLTIHSRHDRLTIHSRHDRLTILTTSRPSARVAVGQPSRRAVHRQFGRGPDPLQLVGRQYRPPSPSGRLHAPNPPLDLEIITPNPPSPAHGGEASSIVLPTISPSYTHGPLGAPLIHGNRRRQSSTNVVVDTQNPSTELLPISTDPQPLTDEPFVVGTATVHSSPVAPPMELRDALSPLSSTSSSVVLDFHLPDGRFLQLINSDQVPRYTKNIVMQVVYAITSSCP
ncbi:hypothetical protein BC826DRAFT_53931 [Russula brevipes]|nr:hypothetical protein BC826DRAFT_53931 [Russula brevipes]